MTNEEKAIKVMQYIADNEAEIKKQIRKNTTAESEDFLNDIFQEATLKMAESILKNGTEVKDLKNFVYISMRNCFVIKQNQIRKKRNNMTNEYENLRIIDENENEEEKWQRLNDLICDIKCAVIERFNADTADMFMDYWSSKAGKNGSYQAVAKRFNTTPRNASQTIKSVMEYILSDSELKSKYIEITTDNYDI